MGVNINYSELMFIFQNIFELMKIDEKKHAGRDFIFEEKREKVLQKILGCKFIRINTSEKGYANYEIGRMQTFIISMFKNRQLRKLKKESNKKKDGIKKSKL